LSLGRWGRVGPGLFERSWRAWAKYGGDVQSLPRAQACAGHGPQLKISKVRHRADNRGTEKQKAASLPFALPIAKKDGNLGA
jgi:hypothetical protein